MEVVEITPGVSFSTAVELRGKRRRWVNGTHKSSSGNSGGVKPARIVPSGAGAIFAEQQKRDRKLTEENQRTLVVYGGKRRFMTMKEYREGSWKE